MKLFFVTALLMPTNISFPGRYIPDLEYLPQVHTFQMCPIPLLLENIEHGK